MPTDDALTMVMAQLSAFRTEVFERLDKLVSKETHAAEYHNLGNKIATVEAKALRLEARVDVVERTQQETVKPALTAYGTAIRLLEAAPDKAAERKSTELRNLSVAVGIFVTVIGACNAVCAGILGAVVQVVLHTLK